MMKQRIFFLGTLLLVCGMLSAARPLTFKEGRFKIAQFTDLHWDPSSAGCAETAATIRYVLQTEQPQLAVLTGDVITGDPAGEGWRALVRIFEAAHTPFVVTMGNHDAEFLSRKEIFDILHRSPLYAAPAGNEPSCCGHAVIEVGSTATAGKTSAALYLIDSNDYQPVDLYGVYDWVHFEQIAWYREQAARLAKANGGQPVPSLAFFHIPLPEYKELLGSKKAYGNALEKGVACPEVNSGLFTSFLEMKGMMGVFTGHDHDNDYIGLHKGVALAYGRVTGKDAYGELTRGARIIVLHEGVSRFETYITTPQGREPAYHYPAGLNDADAARMHYLPAVQPAPETLQPGVNYVYREGKCKKVADIARCPVVSRGVLSNFSLSPAKVADHFAFEYEALLQVPERGVYKFYTFSDDGSVLYIDGEKVVDNDGGHSVRRREGVVALEKGLHRLRLLYFEDYMGEHLEVGISSNNLFEAPIPDNMLFRLQ